jgi:hypothetical protein
MMYITDAATMNVRNVHTLRMKDCVAGGAANFLSGGCGDDAVCLQL